MSARLHVATRKGLFTLSGGSHGWQTDRVDFLGHPVSMVLEDPRDGALFAALNLGHFGAKLHRSRDQGATWEECAVPQYPIETPESGAEANSAEPPKKPASLKEIWALEAGGPDQPGVLWAGTIPGGLFRSNDSGTTWELVRSLWDHPDRLRWFGGGKDEPGIHSICVDPRDSQHVTLGVSCGGVWVTRDGGATWACRAKGMRAEFMPPDQQYDPTIQDAHRLVQCAAAPDQMWVQHHNGIFRSTDGSESWTELKDVQPSVFGFTVAVHPTRHEVAWFVPGVKDECRLPVDGKLVVTRTRDGGQSFESLSEGLPTTPAYDIVYRHCLDVDGTGEVLAMGSTTGSLWISENGGDQWNLISAHLPPIYAVRFAS